MEEGQKIPEELIDSLRNMLAEAKRVRGYVSEEDWGSIEESLVMLITDIIHSWMRKNNIDPNESAIRIEVEEEEIEVELPRRITRFRMR